MQDTVNRHGLRDFLGRQPWMDHAACRGMDQALFFPLNSKYPVEAKRACVRCPVRVSCLDYAIDEGEEHGLWGGLNPNERRVIGDQRRRELQVLSEHRAQELVVLDREERPAEMPDPRRRLDTDEFVMPSRFIDFGGHSEQPVRVHPKPKREPSMTPGAVAMRESRAWYAERAASA